KYHIDRMISEWSGREDPSVEKFLMQGGMLSFPHTYLDASLGPIVRTVWALLKTGKKRVIALGVMHGLNDFDPSKEFSLDNFRYVLKRSGELYGYDAPELEEVFLPMRPRGEGTDQERSKEQAEDVRYLKKGLDIGSALVMTGDLAHYGAPYGTRDMIEDPADLIKGQILDCLELIYSRKDPGTYYERSIECGNDQWAVATAASSLFDEELDHEVFSLDLADYSDVFQVPPPCLVASVFYGVWPK
ncbi:MAG: hypothetical protein ACMUHU_07385, partial [Thermoplasmatota archaeon]